MWVGGGSGGFAVRLTVVALGLVGLAGVTHAAETVTYTYDARGRLVQAVRSGGPSSGTQVNYTHDAAGNRTRVQVTGAPHR